MRNVLHCRKGYMSGQHYSGAKVARFNGWVGKLLLGHNSLDLNFLDHLELVCKKKGINVQVTLKFINYYVDINYFDDIYLYSEYDAFPFLL